MYESIIERGFILNTDTTINDDLQVKKKWYNAYTKMSNGQCTNRY